MRLLYNSVFLALLLVSMLLSGCSKQEEKTEPIIRPVRYEKVFMTGGSRVRTFSGSAQAGTETNLSFKVPGTVIEIPVKVGDKIKKNQIIAKLDAKDYDLQVQEAEAALQQALAQERNAKASYDRVRELYENRTTSKSDLDAARAASESAEAAVKSIEKRLELAKLQVDYTTLRAPADGSIASVMTEVNENVAGGKPVVVLTSGKKPEVKVTIPEAMISQIKKGSSANVHFDAIPDQTFMATVTEVGVSSTGFETTFPVVVRLNNETEDVRPGMAAEVSFRFETSNARERILVPSVAVAEDRQGRYVFIVEPVEGNLGIARRRNVKIGELTDDGLEILEGLQEGDLVVTAGVTRIVDGQKVRLL